jgi:hypothetical protein
MKSSIELKEERIKNLSLAIKQVMKESKKRKQLAKFIHKEWQREIKELMDTYRDKNYNRIYIPAYICNRWQKLICTDYDDLHEKQKLINIKIADKIIDLLEINEDVLISDEEISLNLVKQNALALQNIKNQTEEICIEAVKQNSWALQFVKKQTENICFEAVKQNGYALQFVENQTERICLEAIKQNEFVLPYVRDQTEEICLEAVKRNGWTLQFVENQTKEICLEAIKKKNEN